MGNVRAKFFKDGDFDRVEISIVGDPNTFIKKVEPSDIKQFPLEWESYRAGEREVEYGGTPLTDVPGVDPGKSVAYKLKGVHNAEMLAELTDAGCRNMGLGALSDRRGAQLLLKANEHDRLKAAAPVVVAMPADQRRGPGRPPKAKTDETAPIQ